MLKKIFADDEFIYLQNDCVIDLDADFTVDIYSPATGENILIWAEKPVSTSDVTAGEKSFTEVKINRYRDGKDRIFDRFDTVLGGVCYCSETTSACNDDYPDVGSIKGLQISDPDDAKILGVKHTAINISIGDLFRLQPDENTEPWVYEGETYNINMSMVRHMDGRFRRFTEQGILINLIMLCGKSWQAKITEEIKPILLHPDYNDEGILSAFNVVTDIGIRYYKAFCAFIAKRWINSKSENGRVYGLIVSNEVTSQWVWGNSGEKTCHDFSEEYLQAMRIAYLAGACEFKNVRVYCSMDHFWGKSMDEKQPLRYYGGLELLTELGKIAREKGDFYYNIAHHPYPQDLFKPDFWNDTLATTDMNTELVTFKNLEILGEFVNMEENCYSYDGRRRRIILSEQGFNSKNTPESEILQAAAYGRAYRKTMSIPEIDAFILHAHCDNRDEGGLNLGLWRRKQDSVCRAESQKPIYYLFKVIDTIDDTGKYVYERF